MYRSVTLLVAGMASALASTSASPAEFLDGELSDSYVFADRNEILIDAPAMDIWPHLVDLGSWMYEFDLTHEWGPIGGVGEIRRLYAGEEYFVEIVKLIPNELLVLLNLPSVAGDEAMVGVAMITLTQTGDGTLVSLSTSREYRWLGDGPDTRRATRESGEFQESTRATWDRFLGRLRDLAESRTIEGDASP